MELKVFLGIEKRVVIKYEIAEITLKRKLNFWWIYIFFYKKAMFSYCLIHNYFDLVSFTETLTVSNYLTAHFTFNYSYKHSA